MRIQTIKEVTRDLAARYAAEDLETGSFRDKTLIIYKQKIVSELSALLTANETNDADLIRALESYLKENWSLIQGSSLCYTAWPNDEITKWLISIAQFIADEKKILSPDDSVPRVLASDCPLPDGHDSVVLSETITETNPAAIIPIHLLMPSIALEAARDGFPNLGPDVDIQHILQTHILGNKGLYLLPVRLVTELTLAADPTKKISNPYYDLYKGHPENAGFIDKEEHTRLMEHSPLTQAVFDTQAAYDSIASDTSNLLGQLRILCRKLSFNSSHGGVGQAKDAATGAYPAIIHFMEYYNKIYGSWLFRLEEIPPHLESYKGSYLWVDEKLYYVSQGALLEEVSITNMGLFEEKLNADFDTEQPKGAAARQFPLSVIHIHELITANGGHNPFILDETKKLPPALQQEIYKLFELTTQKTVNVNATAQLETCIGTRCAELLAAMGPHEALLSDISLSHANKRILVDKAQRDFKAAINALTHALDSKKYADGYAKLGIHLTLLETLHVPLVIRSLNDLNLIQSLSPAEISNLCQSEYLKKQIMTHLSHIGDLVLFLMNLSPEKMAAFLIALHPGVLEYMIGTPENLSELLISFDAEKCEVIMTVFHQKIKKPNDFLLVLRHLEPEQCAVVCKTLPKDHLQKIINNAIVFKYVISNLRPELRTVVFNALPKERFQHMIKNAENFSAVMSFLNPEQSTLVFSTIKDRWHDIINSAEDFGIVMLYLKPEQRAVVFNALKDHMQEILQNADDYSHVMSYLESDQRSVLFSAMTDCVQGFIKSAKDFCYVMNVLKPEERTVIFNALKDHCEGIIKTTDDFQYALYYLNPEQCTVVCMVLKNHLQDIIKTVGDFSLVMQHFKPLQRAAVCGVIHNQLVYLIQSEADYRAMTDAMDGVPTQPLLDAFSLYQAIQSIQCIVSAQLADALLSALVTNDHPLIKRQIDAILQPSNWYCFLPSIWSNKNALGQGLIADQRLIASQRLIAGVARLQPYWLEKISVALGVNNTIEAFSEYVNQLDIGQKNMQKDACPSVHDNGSDEPSHHPNR